MKSVETNISICGHAKHGKSTFAGRLLYELGGISKTDLDNLRKEAEQRGKDFNEYSLLFLKHRSNTFSRKTAEPDDPSRTVFPERAKVRIEEGHLLTLIDTPGFSRFLDNIIYGIHQSDLAALVVEAAAGVGLGTIGVTRILASFAIPLIGVFVTKMDVVGYSKLRFNEVKEELEELIFPILQRHHEVEPPIIPVSALSGVGFRNRDKELDWYDGINALEAIQEAQARNAPEAVEQVRFVVGGGKEIYSPPGVGTVLVGTLESGKLRTGDELVLQPASEKENKLITIRVRSVQRARSVTEKKSENVDVIPARAIVAVAASGLPETDAERYLRHGGILGTKLDQPSVANEIEAELIFFEPSTVYSGKDYVILTNASRSIARILTIEGNPKSVYYVDEKAKDKHKLEYDLSKDEYDASAEEVTRAKLSFSQPVCIESSMQFQRLTRFILREQNRIVACGRCLSIIR